MMPNGRKIVLIGGGIAGLCAAVYALKCGYQVEVLEMHDTAGGLAMSWRRGPFTFETCLHWLLGSKPGGELHDDWLEVFDIDSLTFVNHEELVRLETDQGDSLSFYTNVDRLEAELCHHSPQDAEAIHEFTHAVRALGKFRLLEPGAGLADNWLTILRDASIFPLISRLTRISGAEYANRFTDPLLKSFFGAGDLGKMSAIALVFSLAWMNLGNAGYPIGGSQAVIRHIEQEITSLGGAISFKSRVKRILVENNTAVGVQLDDGKIVRGDWVVSAADGHSTLFQMLDPSYIDATIRKLYEELEPFPSYLQVSLGLGLDLSGQPPFLTRLLDKTIRIDPATEVSHVGFRIFNYDPTFAPKGKTVVTSVLTTSDFAYWTELRNRDQERYRAEKMAVADAVIEVLAPRFPEVRDRIEMIDVSTPATVIRYTGNWRGSMEGWMPMPGTSFKPLPNMLPHLRNFIMAGQWIMPGGGLPSGLMTGRMAVKSICKHEHLPFKVHAHQVA
jgi:phytoene dehydrogenase-like protein